MAFAGRFFDPPAQSCYLFGPPRGTGKSAWTQHRYRDSVRIDLLRPATLQRYRARPDRLSDLVHAQPHGQVIVIDEVQRVAELLSVVHALIEEHRGWRFVLTGSSARKLPVERRRSDGGPGRRADYAFLHGGGTRRRGRSALALQRGLLPLALGAEDPAHTLAGLRRRVRTRRGGAGGGTGARSGPVLPVPGGVHVLARPTHERQQHRPRQ